MKKVIFSSVIGLILGVIICCIYYNSMVCMGCVDYKKAYGVPELMYYFSQPLGVFGTFVAIVVAVFGTEIKNLFFSPKCKIAIVGDCFEEDLGHTASTSSPSAQFYKCTLLLKNTGSKELVDLQLVLKDVYFIPDNGKSKKINRTENILFWINPEIKKINLRETEQKDIIVARIYPEASEGTPDNSTKSPLRFSITGINLDKKYTKKGKWCVRYCIQTPHKIIKNFQIELGWSGKWCNRINEMSNEVSSKINEIKV